MAEQATGAAAPPQVSGTVSPFSPPFVFHHSTQPLSRPKAIIKSADMSEEMQQVALQCAREAMANHQVEKDVSSRIRDLSFVLPFDPPSSIHCCDRRF